MLELRGLTRRPGDLVALDDLSFTVGVGQMFGFVGLNGAGKTTAMRIILGVLQPDVGEVLWRGHPMDDAARRRVGYMPGDQGLCPCGHTEALLRRRMAEIDTQLAELQAVRAELARTWAQLGLLAAATLFNLLTYWLQDGLAQGCGIQAHDERTYLNATTAPTKAPSMGTRHRTTLRSAGPSERKEQLHAHLCRARQLDRPGDQGLPRQRAAGQRLR
jgi:ABC-type branched-subunit amino acid transport system ATPase component